MAPLSKKTGAVGKLTTFCELQNLTRVFFYNRLLLCLSINIYTYAVAASLYSSVENFERKKRIVRSTLRGSKVFPFSHVCEYFIPAQRTV